MNMRNTVDIFPSEAMPSEEEITRFIDVHIYYVPPTEAVPPCVESAPGEGTISVDAQEPVQPRRSGRTLLFVGVGMMCSLVISVLVTTFLLPLLSTPTVTVTIVPLSRQISITHQLTVSSQSGTAGVLPGRALPSLTMSQEQTVSTTGQGHQNATQATGFVTFYNAATFAQQIPAGTLLTGADEAQVVTDQTAYLPAGTLLTNGHSTALAHAVMAGPRGNIPAGVIYGPCCLVNVQVASGAFTGGQNARTYRMVRPSDINGVASSLKTSLIQSAQAALQQQVQPGETLITPLPCRLTSTSDRQPGAEATHVRVTASETCTGMAYNTQAMHRRSHRLLTRRPFNSKERAMIL